MSSRSAVVTGAASGIGRALAVELASFGYRLSVVDVAGGALGPLASNLGADSYVVDVASADAVESLADSTGAPDLLCLNAGVLGSTMGAPWEAPPDEWRRVLDINVGGIVNGLRAYVPLMRKREAPASILITASLAGLLTWPGGGPYAASKHAAVTVAEQAALALDGTNVSVTLLCPALVRSGMSEVGEDPADVARTALAAVEEKRFVVAPPEWSGSFGDRAETLASGRRPVVPSQS